MIAKRVVLLGLAAVVGSASISRAAGRQNSGQIVLNIVDPPGVGFNDPRPVSPVGGNGGTTLGAQRKIVFETAASIWEVTLDPEVDIVIQSSFSPLPCTAASGVLGAAGTIQVFANFEGAEWPNTWYHSALGNHLQGEDLTPGPFDPGLLVPPFNDDIVAFFNGDIGVNPSCLTGLTWYNGLDNKPPSNGFDLLNVVLHEFAHGLGFANFADDDAGTAFLGIGDIYQVYSRDDTSGLFWNQMNKSQRSASAVNTSNLVWRGPNVFDAAPDVLGFRAKVLVEGDGEFEAQRASFGASLKALPGVTAPLAVYNDGTGVSSDACDGVDSRVRGKIALIDRGTCVFPLKAANAQASGAKGVVIANNVSNGFPTMGGADLVTPRISSVGVTQAAGAFLKTRVGVNVTLAADPSFGLAGTDDGGFPRLYAPDPVQPGSSVSHWDITLSPNALMEPFLNADLKGAKTLDLTPAQMTDIGWNNGPHCPVGSDDRATVQVGSCSTGVFNALGPFAFSIGTGLPSSGNANGIEMNGGCYIQDMVNACLLQSTSGQVGSCIEHTANHLANVGAISSQQAQAIKNCAT
ncbi:MAG TPA: PA domain-containing protein [Vicinamibacteria bacterium]